MTESVKTEGVMASDERRDKCELIVPLDESDFKPRLHKYVCQYCGYTSKQKVNVDKHINSQHEMNIWYKCNYCKHASVDSKTIKLHIKQHHNVHVNSEVIRDLIVDDPKEISCLKRSQIKKRRLKIKRRQPIFKPIDKKDFKPREDPYSCQYCDYTYQIKFNVDKHVNYVHEMTQWYQCKDCEHASLSKHELRVHMIQAHNQYPDTSCLESFLIKDEEIVEHLKYMKSKKKNQNNKMNSTVTPKEYHNYLTPMDKANFIPRINPKNCPYCSYVGKQKRHTDIHVNCKHEMTKWFKCIKCNFTTLSPQSFIRHMKSLHSVLTKKSDGTLREFTVENLQEIEDLKKRRIQDKTDNEKLSELSLNKQIKDEIGIEEHSIDDEDNDTITKNDESLEAALSDLKEEILGI